MDYLDEIVAYKRAHRPPASPDLEERAFSAAPARAFAANLGTYRAVVIAECKKASPSRGTLIEAYEPVRLAQLYAQNGASAVSVLTDSHFFGGCLDDLIAVKAAIDLPVLRKDFTLDQADVLESRANGADIILLIARILEQSELERLLALARELHMDALVEVHDEADVDKALRAAAQLLGINNRDLGSFATDLSVTERLLKLIPSRIPVISESGIHSGEDVARLREVGIRGVLVGEALIKAPDTSALLREMVDAGCPDCWSQRQLQAVPSEQRHLQGTRESVAKEAPA